MENDAYISAESQRLQDEHEKFVDVLQEKDRKIAFSKELIQETRKTLTSAKKCWKATIGDIISTKEEKIITLYDLFINFVPSQANDSTIEPKKYSTVYE
ncbi:hypothetical protein C1646_753351 [Rhizophagus diaphanus]|nr:hypothetical protein C1646_753351 [Rhizophagus diaphanus] [Rhizophagus sp. MUCL 43196]